MAVDPLAAALHDLAKVFGDGMTAMHVGGKFTCSEAETIADVLTLGGHPEAAATWLYNHAQEDEGSDSHGICGGCDATLYIDDDRDDPVAMDLRGGLRCPSGADHAPASWVDA